MFLRRPHDRLSDGHAEEVLPADGLLVRIGESLLRHHADGAPAGRDLFDNGVVAQARRHRLAVDVVAHHGLGVFVPGGLVLLAVDIFGVRLEMQEVSPDRAIAVLESGQDDAVFHLRHLGADFDGQGIGRGAAPGRIPGPSHAFADGAGLEDVRRPPGADDDGLGVEDVEIPGTDVETDGAGDPVGFGLVHQQMGHHDPVVNFGGGLARGLGHHRLVAFAVDHDLPLALALVAPGFRVPHDGQAPLLELVHRGVHVPRDIVAQVFAH